MSALVPLSGSIIRQAEYFFDPALSFAQGWNTMYNYSVGIPAEIVAAGVLIEFWISSSQVSSLHNSIGLITTYILAGMLSFRSAVQFG